MSIVKSIYKVTRAILFTAIALVVTVFLLLFLLLSSPSFQSYLQSKGSQELAKLLGADVKIGRVYLRPFNEAVIRNVEVFDKNGEKCVILDKVGVGIRISRLLSSGEIELSYAEIIGLNANLYQNKEGEPLNIQFIIDALKPKDKNKPESKFDLSIHNIVLRRCAASFERRWMPRSEDSLRFDINHIFAHDINADLQFPTISNDEIIADIRRLSLKTDCGLDIDKISFKASYTPNHLSVSGINVNLPESRISVSDIDLSYNSPQEILQALKSGGHEMRIDANPFVLKDFSSFVPQFQNLDNPLAVIIDASAIDGRDFSFSISAADSVSGADVGIDAGITDFQSIDKFNLDKCKFNIKLSDRITDGVATKFLNYNPKFQKVLSGIGDIDISGNVSFFAESGIGKTDLSISSDAGNIEMETSAHHIRISNKKFLGNLKGNIFADLYNLGELTGYNDIAEAQFESDFDVKVAGKEIDGDAKILVQNFAYKGLECGVIEANLSKSGADLSAGITVNNSFSNVAVEAQAEMAGNDSWLELHADVNKFVPSALGLLPKYEGYSGSFELNSSISGIKIDDLTGEIRLNDLSFVHDSKPNLNIGLIQLSAEESQGEKELQLKSDIIDGSVRGDFKVEELRQEISYLVSQAFPALVRGPEKEIEHKSAVDFNFTIKPDDNIANFFNFPLRPIVDIPISGYVDAIVGKAGVVISTPYLQQGKNKLLSDNRLQIGLDAENGSASVDFTSSFPAKKGDMTLSMNMFGKNNRITTDIDWVTPSNHQLDGSLSLRALLKRNELSNKPEVKLDIVPSIFDFGQARWNINHSSVTYENGAIDVNGLKIWHDAQFVAIDGRASKNEEDSISVRLADIDLGYVFETLNINYVNFGGMATGDVTAKGVMSGLPVARTDNLFVRDFSYNGSVLGDAQLRSNWDNDDKKVNIFADITGEYGNHSTIDGGIWVTRDSLSFEIDADRIPAGFVGTFMSAFASDVKGKASGYAKLYGTFSDIDLVGRLLADSIALKINFTNVGYHATDSIFMYPGRIEIPSMILYDKEGHSAILSGQLKHRYFHDPVFNFKISDVRNMLCYDTNSKINPDWYGKIYGNGSATVKGIPGKVTVGVDMSTSGKSWFTLVLNETQAAEDYKFLTFSDKKKEEAERIKADSIPPVLAALQKKKAKEEDHPSTFELNLRGVITPAIQMTLVMDPVAGDKITARGSGNFQMDYDDDKFAMYGKYTLDEGTYNFSLQDLILKEFKIKPGSSVAFNGDPFNARLNIAATYRVNTNLSDLDKSFSTDRDLARTNVPVDAVLKVDGEMQRPDITFDIELPTLTHDVERKVKSIISTDDMMSRQIIYLLALNRFYTPEYMGSSSNGGELASVASSTLSSQLTNMIGQLTDKVSVAPTFRSDKGDFSDLEVDVALSSRLLNNRLLVNGNFGYRDRNTSQTTFVGDFDIEYLLSRNGNLRLKAYNHFNDQNYYLRQALTTQGLGVIWRKDFDNPFYIFRKKKDDNKKEESDSASEQKEAENVEKDK